MDFRELDPVVRAVLMGALFLTTLGITLATYYAQPDETEDGRERAILFSLIVAAVATLPGLFISAFALDVSRQTIINPAAWLSIVATLAAVGLAVLRRLLRPRVVAVDFEDWQNDPYGGGSVVAQDAGPTAIEGNDLTNRDSATTTVARVDPPDDRTQIVRRAPPTFAYLAVRSGPRVGSIYQLADDMTIGRTSDNAMAFDDTSVSRQHARIRLRDGAWTIADLDSTNGSFLLDGSERTRITSPHRLSDGDRIEVGAVTLQFVYVGDSQ